MKRVELDGKSVIKPQAKAPQENVAITSRLNRLNSMKLHAYIFHTTYKQQFRQFEHEILL